MSKWDKLVTAILEKSPNLRFDDLCKALESIGYQCEQPRGGSSHYTFRKSGCMPITIPKQSPMNRAYIKLVAEAVQQYLESEE
ncbi:type II toxin-antitoxin system HicA family toxin [uncultured Dysosmobacter sp.]|uniref:type II toxin-antitoxin system HicA family toxin n=1 Tax=uncultured Dysosmobacter sp. TaxID=2591384 RepID=UPI002637E5E2|nr:type II toxin-antitoxin system HicA family toxin [uncultured Dysosmobacter sp.]